MRLNGTSLSIWMTFIEEQVAIHEDKTSSPGKQTRTMLLKQNYPNPFITSTCIWYKIEDDAQIELTIYTLFGQEVITLAQGKKTSGQYNVSWNGSDNKGIPLPGGVYICVLKSEASKLKQRMVLLR
jgi:flagellar hook assembly protein FlgD